MTPRTLTAPPTDRGMWRRLIARVHPDGGGEHELFIWTQALFEHVAGDRLSSQEPHRRQPPPHPNSKGERIPFDAAFDRAASFTDLTRRAVASADAVGEPYARLLRLLEDCYEAGPDDVAAYRQQHQGATYKQLAFIAYMSGMSKAGRAGWYEIARAIPLSQRHAGHIITRIQERAA